MIAAGRAAALLAAALALCACQTTAARQAEEKKVKDEAKAADEANPKGKAVYYRKVTQLSEAWMQAYTGSDPDSKGEAEALGHAVAREVTERFAETVEDLRSSDNPRFRASAARGLGFVLLAEVRPALEGALGDADPSVLASALVSLARIASVDTDDARVAPLLSFPDKVVAGDAALCLARIFQARRKQGLPVLAPARVRDVESDLQLLLFDPADPILRGTAAQALGELGTPIVEDALLNCVRDENLFVRMKVVQALARVGTHKGYDLLLDSLGREESKNVQAVTALAIGNIAERQGLKPPYADLKSDAALWRQWLKK